ncbi:hypothetical protein UCRPC4_g00294 [Phaeomoniella chlamydospora]|uniref:Uncharacterized protein n=1 Tax=Phaeomoniella chlamydospora TaxID=158046 RepID=A0A0G2HKN6_PHACM|nr:hypothetical protein UCRPC4_g00294 [Phaeomoniella chlamydospora]
MARLRLSTLALFFAFCFITFIVFTSSNTSSAPKLDLETKPEQSDDPKVSSSLVEKLLNLDTPSFRFHFQTSAHKPPEQQNSTSGDTSWFSDWKWLNPFSSSITLDEDRSVLPPLTERTPIYTYYDTTVKRDKETEEVDQQLLLTWRRAWWAYGFKPVILGPADAQANLLYENMQRHKLGQILEFELARFLAWGNMGSGLLSSYHCFPMGMYDDDLLVFLRRGDFPQLIRFDDLGAGLFAGPKNSMNDAVKDALIKGDAGKVTGILEAVPEQHFRVEQPSSIAHYDSATITARYPSLAEELANMPNLGRKKLIDVINAHLHVTWQNSFRKGIVVLKPLPKHTTALIEPSAQLAELLAECPQTPLPASCPPNHPRCSPCVSNKVSITTREAFRNTSEEFTIATVPHPYTLTMLNNQSELITVAHIRRYTERDSWITRVTKELLGARRGGPSRVVGMKQVVASDFGLSRGLWYAVDQLPITASAASTDGKKSHTLPNEFLADLDWYFGFTIPRAFVSKGESETPVPGPERRPKSQPGLPVPKKKSWDVDPATEQEFALELELLGKARAAIKSKDPRIKQITTVAELWNLADTEAWRFVKAWRARSTMERAKWEDEEKGYGVDRSARSGRWF